MLVRLLAMVNLCLVFPHVKHYICSPAQRQPWSEPQCSGSVSICNTVRTASFIIILLYANLRQLPQKSLSNSLFLRESNCARESSLSYLDCLQFSGQRFGKTLPAVFSGKLLTNIAICDSLYTLSVEYRCSPITVFSENRVAASKMQ